MEKRQLGRTDMQVTALGFGGAETGFARTDPAEVAAILNAALDAGLNVLDTAECYGTGEESIGKAVSHRRKDYFLFTKCGHASGLELPDWDVRMLEQSIDRSLERLQTDHVDLVQLHSCSEEILRQGDVIEVLQKARQAGKTRYIGYSGDNAAALYAVNCGAFDTLQISINLADQWGIENTLLLAREMSMGVIVKRPIANTAWRYTEKPDNGYVIPYWERFQQLQYGFLNEDLSIAAGFALRFTLGLPGVHTAIVGTSKAGRWQENALVVAQGPLPANMIEDIRSRWKATAGADWNGQT